MNNDSKNWLDVLSDGQMFRDWFSLIAHFFLGIAYLTFLSAGFAFALGTSVILVGIPLLLFMLATTRVLARLDRQIMGALLDTATPEVNDDVDARGANLGALYVPCGGGGLVAGSALAIKSFFPGCAVYAVEPKGYDDHARSLAAGRRVPGEGGYTTLCDGLRAPLPGELTFAINRRELAGALTVDDAAVRSTMAAAVRHFKIVVEPSGAAALAAVLASPPRDKKCVGVILSGGNVDPPLLGEVLRAVFN